LWDDSPKARSLNEVERFTPKYLSCKVAREGVAFANLAPALGAVV